MWIADNQEAVASSVASGRHPHRILAYPPEVYELAQKWLDELHEKTYGPTLQAYANVYYDRPKTAADHEMVDRMMDEAMKTALPHRQRSTRPTDVVVDEILNEIEVELGITIKRKSE